MEQPTVRIRFEDSPQFYRLRIGTARQQDVHPQRHRWCRSSLDWAMTLDARSQSPKQRPQ